MAKEKTNILSLITLTAFIILSFFLNDGTRIIQMHPASIHQWRQSDCVAYGRRYYEDNNPLFQPATYFMAGKDGKVASELPIIYYLGSKLCHVTGFNYWIFRGLTFFCYLIGLIYLYKTVRLWIQRPMLALFPVLILGSSGFYYYYALNFLPNVPAIALSFAGLYYMIIYIRNNSYGSLAASTFLFSLSVLLKPPDGGLTWLSCVGAILVICLWQRNATTERKALKGILIASAIIGSFLIWWYLYVQHYNDVNGNHQNLQGFYSIRGMDEGGIRYILQERILHVWSKAYQSRLVLGFFVLLLPIYFIMWRKLDSFLKYFSLFTILGTICYALLWFKAFNDHDYYQLIFVISPTFVCICLLEYYERALLPKWNRITNGLVITILISLVIAGIAQNKKVQTQRYSKEMLSKFNEHLYELSPYLDKWGIGKKEIVLCLPDLSPNISLVAIGRRGFSEEFYKGYDLGFFKKRGVQYVIISDTNYLHDCSYKPYLNNLVGRYADISVYDISQEAIP